MLGQVIDGITPPLGLLHAGPLQWLTPLFVVVSVYLPVAIAGHTSSPSTFLVVNPLTRTSTNVECI